MIHETPDLLCEAEGSVKEIAFGVASATVSSSSSSPSEVRINILSLEGERISVSLTERGFRVVERKSADGSDLGASFPPAETIHALMDQLSPKYRTAFGESLFAKLASLT